MVENLCKVALSTTTSLVHGGVIILMGFQYRIAGIFCWENFLSSLV